MGSEPTNKWQGRPWLARALRIAVRVVPFVMSVGAAYVLASFVPPARTVPGAIVRLLAIAAVATLVLYAADRLTRRLLPLAALLDLTLLFPDQAPSRYRLALRTGGTAELRRRLDVYADAGAETAAAAAERLLQLVAALSKHDRLTRGHSERVRAYSQMIGAEFGLTEDELDKIRWAGLIHDVGKLRVPAEILNKPGKLTPEEFEIIKRHPADGAVLAYPLSDWLGDSVRAVAEHHERWDGTGYPYGLAGTEISFAARIVAVADAYDVMTSARSYKAPMSPAAARTELARCAGTQFDPVVVRAFLSVSLGRLRVAMGPLSWLTQLSLFPQALLSTAAAPAVTAVTAVAGLTAASVGSVVLPGAMAEARNEEVAVADDGGVPRRFDVDDYEGLAPVVVGATDVDTTVVDTTTTTTVVAAGSVGAGSADRADDPAPAVATTTTEGQATTTVVQATTTAVEPTVAPSETKPPAAPPAPTTTVAAPPPAATTTTLAPATTTTTAPPAATVYLLAALGVGDQATQEILGLEVRAPQHASLPNLDADRNSDPGLTLQRGGTIGAADPVRALRFRLDPAGNLRLGGAATLTLHATSRDQTPGLMRLQVALMRCNDGNGRCQPITTRQVDYDGGRWAPLSVDFGSLAETVPASRNLQLWIVTDDASVADAWIAFDTTDQASALALTLAQ
jgi:HD-GYP domain-containing protein (c-di-GMP phosphodiesterase class II)